MAKGKAPAPQRAGTAGVTQEICALVLHLEHLGDDNPAGLVTCLALLDDLLAKSREMARAYKID